ncbi:MBL fold metallo-hydrolase [Terracidiphilus sp.]|jgi:phosphoribosyl 1,2-cyclic phosphate phosphodiesterase|uniref:MBL fold metallo-hydrolase n=1 Tax=Terracidiphilus sp. TaxID=1964191 RepID=UPI003C288A3F
MQARLTFLGSGTSMGVPTLGCRCAVCASTDTHDKRLRPSVVVDWIGEEGQPRTVLIDTGPDFRQQALRHGITRVDAVFYTHDHADHILGMDDLRPYSFAAFRSGGPIPLYADAGTASTLERIYHYTLAPGATYPNRARVELHPLTDRIHIHELEIIRIPVVHGPQQISGFRFGDVAYLTDVSFIPESSFELLTGLEHLVLPSLRHAPHPSHANVEQAVAWAKRIGARHTWLTHIAHDLGHEETNKMLPPGVALAYDGLHFAVNFSEAGQE